MSQRVYHHDSPLSHAVFIICMIAGLHSQSDSFLLNSHLILDEHRRYPRFIDNVITAKIVAMYVLNKL